MIDEIWGEALRIGMLLTGAPLIVMAILGLGLAVIQTAVSIQEQTFTYLFKLCAMGGVLILLWRLASENLLKIMEGALSLSY